MQPFIGIELTRGIAALMVMTCHYAYMTTNERTILNFLWTGVDLFFVISGFVFTKLIMSSKVNLSYFFIRRFFRIYPLYFVTLIIYYYLVPYNPEKFHYFIKHIFFLHTLNSKEEAFYFNPAFWSLPVEVEFYLFIPILAYFMRIRNSLHLIFIFSIFLRLFLILKSSPTKFDNFTILKYHLTGILPEFLIGIYLYKFTFWSSRDLNNNLKLIFQIIFPILGIILLYFLSIFFIYYGDKGFEQYRILGGFYGFLCALGYALILYPMLFMNQLSISKYLYQFFIAIGAISYPVYLIHNASPKIFYTIGLSLNNNTLFLSCLILTLILSIILHKIIEEPLRLYGRKLSKKFLDKKNSSL